MEFEQKLLSSVFSRCWAQNAIYQHLYICITSLQGHMKSFLKKHFKSKVHNTIGRYETPSLHTAIEMLSGKPG